MSNKKMKIFDKNIFTSLSSDGAKMAKVLATFYVVLGHSYKLFKNMNVDSSEIFYLRFFRSLAASSVPVFFLLAGYYLVFKDNWDFQNNLKKKFRSLMIPYLGFISVYAVISCVGSLLVPAFFEDFRTFTASDWLLHFFGIPFLKDPVFYGPLWFVRELFILNILSFALVPFVKRASGYLLIPLMTFLYFAPVDRRIYTSIPFFMIGIYLGLKKRLPVLNSTVLLIALTIAGIVLPIVFEAELAFNISVLLFFMVTLSISEMLIKNGKIEKMAQFFIPFSFPVYLLHEYPVTTITKLLALKSVSLPVAIVIFLLLPVPVILLCIGVSVLWKRISPKTYSLLTGGRY